MNVLKRTLAVLCSVVTALICTIVVVFGVLYDESWKNIFVLSLFSIICTFGIPIVVGIYVNRKIKYKELEKDPHLFETIKAENELAKQRKKEAAEVRYVIQSMRIKQRAEEEDKEDLSTKRVLPNKKRNWSFEQSGKLQLIGGLGDIPSGSICKIRYNHDHMAFFVSGQEFNLDASKLVDVSIMTPKEIQKQYVSSVGGAVAGAILLGPLGAIIGGAASKKTISKTNRYLVISYWACEEIKYIVFDVTSEIILGNSIQRTYKSLRNNERVRVEL